MITARMAHAVGQVDSSAQLEKNIAAASECIAESERRIVEQRERIQALRDETTKAERVLQYWESVQARYVATRVRMQRMLNKLLDH
jgi:hypothetical protein